MGEIYAALRTTHPNLALAIGARVEDGSGVSSWYGTWDKPDALPRRAMSFESTAPTSAQTARSFSRRTLLSVPYRNIPVPDPKPAPRELYARSLGFTLDREKNSGWDGIVFDLSEVPVEKALPLLAALDPPPPASPAPAAAAARRTP